MIELLPFLILFIPAFLFGAHASIAVFDWWRDKNDD